MKNEMNQEIKNQYQISFINRVIDFDIIGKTNVKELYSNPEWIGLFFGDCGNALDITEWLIPEIESALGDVNSEIEADSAIVGVMIYQDRTEFYSAVPRSTGYLFQMPTTHFLEIAIAWRDFLLEPPLNGSKVDDNGNIVS
jgi:hypothetical protein